MSARRRSGSHAARPRATRRLALTLFEVLISLVIIAVMLATMLMFLWGFLESKKEAALLADRTQIARQILDRVAAELRGCVGMDEINFATEKGQRLLGERRSITFLTAAVPERYQYEFVDDLATPPPAQHDLRNLSYSLWIDPENKTEDNEPIVGGIIRTEKRTLNQFLVDEEDPLQVRNDLWSRELQYLEFRYFDGVEWSTTWDIEEGNSLPQLVQITIGFAPITNEEVDDQDLQLYPLEEYPLGDDQPHPDRYSTIVRIPAADRLFSSRVQRLGKQFAEQFGVEGGGP
ncbi:MAG: hypothetical protein CHACPFDD_01694 [Phycisphaerae bacterium]|nr:hypothetical protein [Phycisphaerae bacterium]